LAELRAILADMAETNAEMRARYDELRASSAANRQTHADLRAILDRYFPESNTADDSTQTPTATRGGLH
jgi:hypothetical protein